MTSGPPQGGPPPGGWGPPPPPSGQPWQPPAGERRNPLAVLGGVVLGLGLGFLVMPWLGIMLGSTASSSGTSSGEAVGAVGVVLGFGLPILLGIAMLVPRRLRRAGAGVLLGLSIGMIVGSASCLGVWGLFIAALSGAH